MAEEKKEIPQELLIEIAKSLPVKSICRFKSISKACNFFFSSPEFVKSHLHRRRAPERIILIASLTPHVVDLATEDGADGSSRELRSERFKGDVCDLLGGCNGLVLFEVIKNYFKFNLVVINPVTLRATSVPVSFTSTSRDSRKEMRFGLGYNSVEDDYKIVMLWDPLKDPLSRNVYIFSLKTRRWKKSANSPYLRCSYRPGVYVDGRLHWLAYKDNGDTLVIIAFDLTTEKFEEVTFPTGFECGLLKNRRHELAEMGGCLALLDRVIGVSDANELMYVWIREKLGEKMCWRKFTIAKCPLNLRKDHIYYNYEVVCCDYEVICRLGEFEFVLSINQEELVAYNWETRVWRVMDIDGLPKVLAHGRIMNFRESLVCSDFRA